MGFTTPTDVTNIVLANIGGIPQIPAPSTLVEGRLVCPQINSLCSLSDTLGALSAQISAALTDLMNNVNTLLLNPLKDVASQVLTAIGTAVTAITGLLSSLSAAVQSAANLALTAISAGIAQISAIVSYVDNMLGQGLNQILGALSMCAPSAQIPSARTYTASDFTSSLNQKTVISSMQTQVTSIQTALLDSGTTDAQKITLLTNAQNSISGSTSILNAAVVSDTTKLATAQLQNQSLAQMTTIAHGLNVPTTSGFLTSVLHPTNASMLQGLSKLVV
jgi:hypothetical protein